MNFDDPKWMREAVEQARWNRGRTSPRPCVGCVIVRDGKLLGAGHTQPGNGQPHAEIMALRAAWRADPLQGARGAAAYTTLEPCSHWGTTPPCCDALAREHISRVVIGVEDPDPRVSGRGAARLRAAGVEVVEGVLKRESFRAMDDFLFHIALKTPFVTLKSATTLDGKIALPGGESQWITGAHSRARGAQFRHEHDAILCGIETVLRDDPQLSARPLEDFQQPIRVILDSAARLPPGARVWKDAPALWVFVGDDAPAQNVENLRQSGAIVRRVPLESAGVSWKHVLAELYAGGIYSVLIEGGARVAGSALEAGIVHKIAWFVAPKLMGAGKSALELPVRGAMSEVPTLRDVHFETIEQDVLIQGYFAHPWFDWL